VHADKTGTLNLGVPVVNFPRANAILARAQALLRETTRVTLLPHPRSQGLIDIGQKLHSWVKSIVKSVPECQPTSGVAAMLKATKPEEIL
jgi:hypothetical protein